MNMPETDRVPSDGSATQRSYKTLRHMIVTGTLKPGDKLKIDALRQMLDTGASPIREALSLLTSDNLVERIDQRGFRTAPISAANFQEILELRCTLEDLAFRASIERATQAWEEDVCCFEDLGPEDTFVRVWSCRGDSSDLFSRCNDPMGH